MGGSEALRREVMSTAAVLEGVLVVLNNARCSLNDDQTDVDDRLYLVQLVLKAELERLTAKTAKLREEVKTVQEETAQVEDAPEQPQKINKARIAQLWAAGKKPKEIADAVGCSEQTVRNWAKREAK